MCRGNSSYISLLPPGNVKEGNFNDYDEIWTSGVNHCLVYTEWPILAHSVCSFSCLADYLVFLWVFESFIGLNDWNKFKLIHHHIHIQEKQTDKWTYLAISKGFESKSLYTMMYHSNKESIPIKVVLQHLIA